HAPVKQSIDLSNLATRDYELQLGAMDVSGSSRCSDPVPIHLDPSVQVQDFQVGTALFSPDGDGILDTSQLSFALDESADVDIAASSSGPPGRSIYHAHLPPGATAIPWNGRFADGTPVPDGDYALALTATDGCAHGSTASANVSIDTTPPVARIDSPASG